MARFIQGLLVAVLVATAAQTLAATQDGDGPVMIRVYPTRAETPEPRLDLYRVFVETEALPIRVALFNESERPIRIDQEKVQKGLVISVSGADGEIPITLHWSNELRLPNSPKPVPTPPGDQVALAEGRGMEWTVAIAKVSGTAFRAGEYQLSYRSPGVREGIVNGDGSPWKGIVGNGDFTLTLKLLPPTTPAESARMHGLVAAEALEQRDLTAALDAYSRATAADPTNGGALAGKAGVLMQLKRYREAIPLYEAVLAGRFGERPLSRFLAQAYVGVGDEGNAIRVLRISGLSEAAVNSEMQNLRRLGNAPLRD
jgi:hypothetical protein